jgi:hypothetical protein
VRAGIPPKQFDARMRGNIPLRLLRSLTVTTVAVLALGTMDEKARSQYG